jgi:hypothetical protein
MELFHTFGRMKVFRSILSISLILAYTTGLASNSFVGCVGSCILNDINSSSHNHEHADFCGDDVANESSHSHISHEDHVDHGMYDYFVCLLSESQHQHNSIEIESSDLGIYISKKDFVKSLKSKISVDDFKIALSNAESIRNAPRVFYYVDVQLLTSPAHAGYSLRGPPSIS